ncbi:hypothetical protein [Streptosporangium sp. NPDC006930]|uniref:hypothetical protein n=1 Tax=unclassified Streptosporangium TaxID=2632669 RepID=UPI00341FF54B
MIFEAFPGGVVDDEMTFSAALDSFIFTKRLDGGQTVVEMFAERLTGEDRALVLSWTDYVQGAFEIKEPYGDDGCVAVNHIDELTYRIRSNMGPAGVEQLTPGVVMVGGIVPVGDDWMISGASAAFPAEDASDALAGVRDLQLRNPELVFRNPEKLARAREIQAAQRESFVDLYGSDMIVVPGDEVKTKVLAFYRHDYERAGSKSGPWTPPDLPDPGFAQITTAPASPGSSPYRTRTTIPAARIIEYGARGARPHERSRSAPKSLALDPYTGPSCSYDFGRL